MIKISIFGTNINSDKYLTGANGSLLNQTDRGGIQVQELTYTASPIINGVSQDEMKAIEIFSIKGEEVPTVIYSSNSRSFQTFQQTINPCDPLQIFLIYYRFGINILLYYTGRLQLETMLLLE
jgi:hypothetical protein